MCSLQYNLLLYLELFLFFRGLTVMSGRIFVSVCSILNSYMYNVNTLSMKWTVCLHYEM